MKERIIKEVEKGKKVGLNFGNFAQIWKSLLCMFGITI